MKTNKNDLRGMDIPKDQKEKVAPDRNRKISGQPDQRTSAKDRESDPKKNLEDTTRRKPDPDGGVDIDEELRRQTGEITPDEREQRPINKKRNANQDLDESDRELDG